MERKFKKLITLEEYKRECYSLRSRLKALNEKYKENKQLSKLKKLNDNLKSENVKLNKQLIDMKQQLFVLKNKDNNIKELYDILDMRIGNYYGCKYKEQYKKFDACNVGISTVKLDFVTFFLAYKIFEMHLYDVIIDRTLSLNPNIFTNKLLKGIIRDSKNFSYDLGCNFIKKSKIDVYELDKVLSDFYREIFNNYFNFKEVLREQEERKEERR